MENDDEIFLKVDQQLRKLSVVSAISAKSIRSNKTTNSHSNYDPEDVSIDLKKQIECQSKNKQEENKHEERRLL